MKVKQLAIRLTNYVFVFFILLLVLLPIFYAFWVSLSPYSVQFVNSFNLQDLDGSAYMQLFNPTDPQLSQLYQGEYPSLLLRTVLLAIITVVLQISFVYMLSYVVSRERFKGKRATFLSLQLIQMIPNIIALPFFYMLATALDMRNILYLALIYVAGAIPAQTILLKGYLDTIPRSLDDAAKIDGATKGYIMHKIILPLAAPMIFTMAIWAFIAPFGDVILPSRILGQSLEETTLAPGLLRLMSGSAGVRQYPPLFFAGAIIIAIPTVALYYIAQKKIQSGLVDGAVKG